MPFTPGPYSGISTLALVARASAFGVGVVYGTVKLSILKVTKPKPKEDAHAAAHH
jgi:translation initiation factor 2B subunit (eIF-2B alpha/beta/delta family)